MAARPVFSQRVARLIKARSAALAPIAVAASAASIFALLAIYRHTRFGTGGFDLGIFDQTLWGYSNFEVIPNTVKRVPNLLGDHFHPAIALLAPGYWLWNDARVVLIEQASLISISSLPVFYLARRRLGFTNGLLLQISYLVFFGTVAAALFDFHEVAVAAPALSLGLWALMTRHNAVFVIATALALLAKEDVALTVVAIGVYAALVQRRWWFGIAVSVVAAAWFVAVIKFIIPLFAGRGYAYLSSSSTPAYPVEQIATHPYRVVTMFVDRAVKVRTLLATIFAWLALPLFSPIVLIAVPSLVTRFWSSSDGRWTTDFHYSLVLAPVLAFASVDTLTRMASAYPRLVQPAVIGLMIASLTVTGITRPWKTLDGLRSSTEARQASDCLQLIPPSASVAASNSFVAHLTHRREVYPLFARTGQDFLAIDARTTPGRRAVRIVEQSRTYSYRRACASGGAVVFRRNDSAHGS
jgi:uncharacterized membrane protein